jgi:hypothetical protein
MYRRIITNGAQLLHHKQKGAEVIQVVRTIVHQDELYPTEMFENPYVRQHQKKRDNVPKDFHKQVFFHLKYPEFNRIIQNKMLMQILHIFLDDWSMRSLREYPSA